MNEDCSEVNEYFLFVSLSLLTFISTLSFCDTTALLGQFLYPTGIFAYVLHRSSSMLTYVLYFCLSYFYASFRVFLEYSFIKVNQYIIILQCMQYATQQKSTGFSDIPIVCEIFMHAQLYSLKSQLYQFIWDVYDTVIMAIM